MAATELLCIVLLTLKLTFCFASFDALVLNASLALNHQDCGVNEEEEEDPEDHPFLAAPPIEDEHNPVGHWPWVGSIGFYDVDNRWRHSCAATLITQRHFLTAAHCLLNTNFSILVGNPDFSVPRGLGRGRELKITSAKSHPDYDNKSAYFDVAVVETEPVEFSRFVRPVCLPTASSANPDNYARFSVELVGWGSSARHGVLSEKLKRVTLKVFPQSYCNSTHSDKDNRRIEKAVPELFKSNLLCAGVNIGRQGACQGDSGGPLMNLDTESGKYIQIGVVHGAVGGCGEPKFPGIYARLDDIDVLFFIAAALFNLPPDVRPQNATEFNLTSYQDFAPVRRPLIGTSDPVRVEFRRQCRSTQCFQSTTTIEATGVNLDYQEALGNLQESDRLRRLRNNNNYQRRRRFNGK